MPLYGYYIAFGVILLIALAATMKIGFSRENTEGNPGYVQKTSGNWFRLSLLYVIAALIALAIIIWVVR